MITGPVLASASRPATPTRVKVPATMKSSEQFRPRNQSALRKYTDPRRHRKHCGKVHSIEHFRGK
jgi:hypothetical protein